VLLLHQLLGVALQCPMFSIKTFNRSSRHLWLSEACKLMIVFCKCKLSNSILLFVTQDRIERDGMFAVLGCVSNRLLLQIISAFGVKC
jgi:hypothetical protein